MLLDIEPGACVSKCRRGAISCRILLSKKGCIACYLNLVGHSLLLRFKLTRVSVLVVHERRFGPSHDEDAFAMILVEGQSIGLHH